jgi:hypothetical protein
MELAIRGAVMMKITTSTSITSTRGVTLMSLKGCGPSRRSSRPNAMTMPACGRAPHPRRAPLLAIALQSRKPVAVHPATPS